MSSSIFYCEFCNNFTLKKTCPKCNDKTSNPIPAKYSPQDKYAKYRKLARKSQN